MSSALSTPRGGRVPIYTRLLDPAVPAETHPLPTEPQGNRSRRASHRDTFLTASNNAPSGGSLESYYWMFGQYDGVGVFELPDSRTMAALSLAASSSGAFAHFETHELIEASDLTAIAERAKGITYQPPGA